MTLCPREIAGISSSALSDSFAPPKMAAGSLAIVLHAHLPFVRHPEHARHLEERWLYEAIIECYLPLVSVFDRLALEGVPFAVTMSLTPPLAAMLKDELLRKRFEDHLR